MTLVPSQRWTVFLGPSVSLAEAQRKAPTAAFHPPIARGDLPRLLAAGHRAFAIIDGEFGQNLSVSLTELRAAAEEGATVVGASSMGALRAAEGHPLGIRGFGWVFEQYRTGVIESDEEVALTFHPSTLKALTVPLVNVRWAALLAEREGALTEDGVGSALRVAAAIPYWERSLKALAHHALHHGCRPLEILCERIERDPRRHDRKALDAIELLDAIASDELGAAKPLGPPLHRFTSSVPPRSELFLGVPDQERKTSGHRRLPDCETLDRAWAEGRRVGVTRLADLTDLESLGLYSYSSLRPYADEGDITVTGGKGLQRSSARIGALLEAVERACLSARGRQIVRGTVEELSSDRRVLHPKALIPEFGHGWQDSDPLPWWPTRDLFSGEEVWVPASAVFLPAPEGPRLFPSTSAGVAVGSSRTEATVYALLEVMERDLATYARWLRRGRPLDLDRLPVGPAREIVMRLRSCGLEVHCWVVFNAFPAPLFWIALDDPRSDDPLYLNGGLGFHPSPHAGLISALTEAVYSRMTVVSGSREDLERDRSERAPYDIETLRRSALTWHDGPPITLDEIPDQSSQSQSDDLAWALTACKVAGLRRVLATDLSLEEGSFSVVRCIVPGAESEITRNRVGPRLFSWIEHARAGC